MIYQDQINFDVQMMVVKIKLMLNCPNMNPCGIQIMALI